MNRLKGILAATLRGRPLLSKTLSPIKIRSSGDHHMEGPPQPFDNMPFDIPNRYVTTVFFSVFFGVGFWAPFLIVWYMMAKKTL